MQANVCTIIMPSCRHDTFSIWSTNPGLCASLNSSANLALPDHLSGTLSAMSAASAVCQPRIPQLPGSKLHPIQRPRHVAPVLAPESAGPACSNTTSALSSRGARCLSCPSATSVNCCDVTVTALSGTAVVRRTEGARCYAHVNAASAVLEVPKDIEVPKEVAALFQKLQNGSDIRGIAIAGQPRN